MKQTTATKILSLLPVVGHPRNSKRIDMLLKAGFEVRALAFDRPGHKSRMPVCSVDVLGNIQDGAYLNRIFHLLKSLPKIRKELKNADVAYASGPDMAYSVVIAGIGLKKPVVLEVGDIREVQVAAGITGKIVRFIERIFIRFCSLLVVTAPGFWTDYYKKRLGAKIPFILIENKLDLDVRNVSIKSELPGSPLSDRPLTIGYFGLLRSKWSWDVLEKIAIDNPDKVSIVAAGIISQPSDLAGRAALLSNTKYLGTYTSPDDLPELYGMVDLVWACYPFPSKKDMNWRWARTNRFYESVFFKKPLIVLEDSGDASAVSDLGIGFILPNLSPDLAAKAVSAITPLKLIEWKKAVSGVPVHKYVYSAEYLELAEAIRSIQK